MGMQIHWDIKDVPDYANITVNGLEVNIAIRGEDTVTVLNVEEGCWFDCGSMSSWSMKMIAWLIRNRIPFNAS